ncbi:hypothetical protein [Galbibacter mesophilus]|uniref:hypothetical protein n=1 Tax=Galbibacter mesophilus TaxID=379069 RepID=UPI00191CA8D6|nr:hypothetical protein [Galbibacter mesophilus]MCM5662180.1 hypothetical protein [Galbibacter mesophilus]
MCNKQILIERFFEQDSFSTKDLNKLWKRIYSSTSKKDLETWHNKMKVELKAYKKNQNGYKKLEARVFSTQPRKRNDDLVRKFLLDNFNSNNSELAKNLHLSLNELSGVAKNFGIKNFDENYILDQAEKELLIDFFDSRLRALSNIEKSQKKKNKITLDKSKKKKKEKSVTKRSTTGSTVYEVIKSRGGIGKLIYTSMSK